MSVYGSHHKKHLGDATLVATGLWFPLEKNASLYFIFLIIR